MAENQLDYINNKVKEYTEDKIKFTKRNYERVLERINCTEDTVKKEVLSLKKLVFVEKEIREFAGSKEERYRCYFVYSNSKGRCYILTFNDKLKIITIFPLGRRTLNKYRKKFKGGLHKI